jgi:hypothetical protein
MARESSPGAGVGAPAARRSTAEAVYSGVGGDLVEEEASLLLLEVRSCLSRGHVLDRRGFDTWLSCLQGDANCAPLAPAKVLRADASVPTRQRSSRATRAAVSTTATASGGSQDASEASRPRLVTSTTEPQQTVVEARQVAEAQPEALVTAAQPATSAAEARPAPTTAEAQLETAVAVVRQEPAATVV